MKLRLDISKLFINDNSNISQQAVYGSIINIADYGFKVVMQLLSTVVLARLLSPDDFGLISISMVILNFVAIFKDAGLSMATIQKKDINQEVITSLFWINLTISFVLGIIVAISAPIVSLIYERTELIGIVLLMSLTFFINGIVIQHVALIRRKMMFLSLSVANVISQLTSFLVSVILALNGFRYWSLVLGTVSSTIVFTLLILLFCPWFPKRYKKHNDSIEYLKTGGYVSGFNFLNYFSRNIDLMLIGKRFGAESVGLYSKAYQIVLFPLVSIREPITAVALPTLSRVRENVLLYKQYYRYFTSIISIISMPLMVFIYLTAYELIYFLFGEDWMSMLGVFKILAIAGFMQAPLAIKGVIMISSDKSKEYFNVGIINTIITVLGIIIGSFWSMEGVAIGYTIAFYIAQFPTFHYIFKVTNLDLRDLITSMLPSVLSSVVAFIITSILFQNIGFESHFITIVTQFVAVFLTFIVVMLFLKSGREQLLGFKKIVDIIKRKGRGGEVC